MKKFFLFVLFSSLLPFFVLAEVSAITFSSGEQSIATNTISEKLTITAAGVIGETGDLELSSSSPTGEFSSSNTNWQPTNKLTMSSNSANRNFYYRDSASGAHVLTATLTGRSSGKSYTATQKMVVGDGNSSTIVTEDEEEGDALEVSSHANPKALTNLEKKIALKVDAGRPRLASVNTPVAFEALTNSPGVKVSWAFGDGTGQRGLRASHSYAAPGTYVVVVTATKNLEQVSSRTKVEVVSPAFTFSWGDGGLLVRNESAREQNIGSWQLLAGKEKFVFAPDTIILPKAEILVPVENPRLVGNKVALHYPGGQVAAVLASRADSIQLAEAKSKLDRLSAQVALSRKPSPPVVENVPLLTPDPSYQLAAAPTETLQSTGTVIELNDRPGWFRKFLQSFFE